MGKSIYDEWRFNPLGEEDGLEGGVGRAPETVSPSVLWGRGLEFVHHCVAHPLLFLFPKASWADRFHGWTWELLEEVSRQDRG